MPVKLFGNSPSFQNFQGRPLPNYHLILGCSILPYLFLPKMGFQNIFKLPTYVGTLHQTNITDQRRGLVDIASSSGTEDPVLDPAMVLGF
jgi:hypothetical protein